MLNFIRTHKRLMLFILVILILPSFVFWGVQGYFTLSSANDLAKVGSLSIPLNQYEYEYKNWVNQQSRQNPAVDPQVWDSPQAKQMLLQQMVQRTKLLMAMQDARLQVTDAALATALRQTSLVREATGEDGLLDKNRYRQFVQQAGYRQPKDFEEAVRQDQAFLRLMDSMKTQAIPQVDIDMQVKRMGQKYTIRQKLFEPNAYADQVKLSDADVKAYYDQHPSEFMSPAKANIEYIVLDREQYLEGITVSQEDMKQFYEQNKDLQPFLQQRKASHILIEVPKEATQEAQDKALAKAKQLLEEVKKDPGKFAELAKRESDDKGSAVKGGDVGLFGPGDMVEAFERAAFSMKSPGIFDEVVSTPEGYHVLMVTEVSSRPFDQLGTKVKDAIEAQIRSQKADAELPKMVELFQEGLHTNPDTLVPIAEKLGLTVQQAKDVTQDPSPEAKGILANMIFLATVFAPQNLDSKMNTQAIQASPTELAAARVLNYTAAHVEPFEKVEGDVAKRALLAKQLELLRVDAQKTYEDWKKTPTDADGVGNVLTISLMEPYATKMAIAQTVFEQARLAQLPQALNVDLGAQGAAVVMVEKIEDEGQPNENLVQYVKDNVQNNSQNAQLESFLHYLDRKYKVKVYSGRLPSASK